MGTDVKTCAKPIKYAPGPGFYNNDSTRGRTFNYQARNGPYLTQNPLAAAGNDSLSPKGGNVPIPGFLGNLDIKTGFSETQSASAY